MKRNSIKLLTAAILLATGQQAFAAAVGTKAGTEVNNTASVSYTVGSVAQTAVANDPAAKFNVDRKVDVTVAAADTTSSPSDVTPKATSQMLTFTVTNNTNDYMDFDLSAVNATGDDFNVSSITYKVESGATPGYQPLEDTGTYIDDLASGDDATVYVFATIPDLDPPTNSVANGKQGGVVLTAIAHDGNDGTPGALGSLTANDAGADVANTVQNVFADEAGTGGDTAKNGKHADTGFYEISTAAISVAKTSFVMWDPINHYTNPKAIPGAVMVYCITVTNPSTSLDATAIAVSDQIDTTYLDYQNQTNVATVDQNNGLALTLSEDAANPSCDAATLIDISTDTQAGAAGDLQYSAGDALYKTTAIPAVDMRTDVQDSPTEDGGYYDSGVSVHTVYANTPTLQAKGTGQTNIATAVFRVKVK